MNEDKIEYASLRIYGTKNAIDTLSEVQDNCYFWDEVVRLKRSGKIETPRANKQYLLIPTNYLQ